MSASVASEPIAAAIIAKLEADLPTSYTVFDAMGPTTPSDNCPYLVVYANTGSPEGEPMELNRSLIGQFSVRSIGLTGDQSRRGGDRVRASLHGAVMTVSGRQVYSWQEYANSVQRDDGIAPTPLFEHLLLFGFRSDL